MNPHEHLSLMAGYNARMNAQVFAAAQRLAPAQFTEDRGAFFGSLQGTLNHLVVADLVWLRRFHEGFAHFHTLQELDAFPRPQALAEILYPELNALWAARQGLDGIVSRWIAQDLSPSDLEHDLVYASMKGIRSARNLGEVTLHLFNHQTHHRGQASTLLYQMGEDVGITDFLVDIPDRIAEPRYS
jgi:uncharacterized damage-inducible protein DinB